MDRLSDTLSILCEACGSECDADTMDDVVLDDMDDEIEGEYEDLGEYEDEDIFYSEEMVPVIGINGGTSYVIEADMLAKYMISNNITEANVAINNIAEHNAIDPNSTGVLVENASYFKELINEAKSCKGSAACNKKKAKIKSGIDLLKDLKNKGIKIVKKKAKGGKTSKKKK